MENTHLKEAKRLLEGIGGSKTTQTAVKLQQVQAQALVAIAEELHRMNELTEFNVPMIKRPE